MLDVAGTTSSSRCAGSQRSWEPARSKPTPSSSGGGAPYHLPPSGADLEIAWSHPAATTATRKRIVRAVLHEIVVRVENGRIEMVLHWQGGDHTPLQVKKNATGKSRWTVEEDVEVLVRELARMMPDQSIAAVLNRAGKLTGRQNGWTLGKVCNLRKRLGVAVYREGERAGRGELTLSETAAAPNISQITGMC